VLAGFGKYAYIQGRPQRSSDPRESLRKSYPEGWVLGIDPKSAISIIPIRAEGRSDFIITGERDGEYFCLLLGMVVLVERNIHFLGKVASRR